MIWLLMKELKLVYVPHEIYFPELNIINQSIVRLIIKSKEQSEYYGYISN